MSEEIVEVDPQLLPAQKREAIAKRKKNKKVCTNLPHGSNLILWTELGLFFIRQ